MDGQRANGAKVAGTNALAVNDYLTRYRVEHPVGEETVRLTLLGVVPGFQHALSRRMWLLVVAVPVAILTMVIGTTLAFVVGIGLVWGSVVVMALIARKDAAAFPPSAAMLSDRRLVAIAGVRSRDPQVLQELSATEVTWATLTEWRGAFPIRHPVCTVTLGGPGGVACELEMPRADPEHLRLVLAEAGLGPAPGRAGT